MEEVHLWTIPLAGDAARVQSGWSLLDEAERERAGRFHFERDRTRFICGRSGLRRLLGQYVNQAPDAIRFEYGPQGKPELANADSTVEQSLRFNLSHSQELGLCAITRGRRLGVDLEQVRAAALDGLEIAERFFTAAETALVRSASAETRAATFLRLWTRKEAYLKGHGKGLSMPLNEFEVSLEGHQVRFPLEGYTFDPAWSVHEVHPKDGYVAALAVEGEKVVIVQNTLEPS